MAQPYDYSVNAPQPNLDAFNSGLTMANNIVGIQDAAAKREALKQKSMADAVAAEKMRDDLGELAKNPTTRAIAGMAINYPHLSEPLDRVYKMQDETQKKDALSRASQVYSTLLAGDTEAATSLLTDHIKQYKEAGLDQDAKDAEVMLGLVKSGKPGQNAVLVPAGVYLAKVMGVDKFTEAFGKIEDNRREANLEPSKLSKQEAEAKTAAVAANFAEDNAVMKLKKDGWDITKIQSDISIAKQNSKIAAMEAQRGRIKDALELKKLDLTIQTLRAERTEKVNEKAAEVVSARSSIDNFITTLDRLIATPEDVRNDAHGPIESRFFTVSDAVSDYEEDLETLKSQTFLATAPAMRGLGALGIAEGARLENGFGSLSLKQSPEKQLKNYKDMREIGLKMRSNIATKYGVPDDTPMSPAEEAALLKKYSQ